MGSPPSVYNGDRTKADDWLEELKMYLRVNRDVAGFDSPIKKVAVALSFIKGPQVAGWVRDYGRVLDTLDPTNDNIPAVWDQFLNKFEQQFMDSQREVRARAQLQQLKADPADMDGYIAKFEELAQQAGYTVGSPEMMQYFLLGIPEGELLREVMKPPTAADYQALKQRAIEHATASQGYQNIVQIQQSLYG